MISNWNHSTWNLVGHFWPSFSSPLLGRSPTGATSHALSAGPTRLPLPPSSPAPQLASEIPAATTAIAASRSSSTQRCAPLLPVAPPSPPEPHFQAAKLLSSPRPATPWSSLSATELPTFSRFLGALSLRSSSPVSPFQAQQDPELPATDTSGSALLATPADSMPTDLPLPPAATDEAGNPAAEDPHHQQPKHRRCSAALTRAHSAPKSALRQAPPPGSSSPRSPPGSPTPAAGWGARVDADHMAGRGGAVASGGRKEKEACGERPGERGLRGAAVRGLPLCGVLSSARSANESCGKGGGETPQKRAPFNGLDPTVHQKVLAAHGAAKVSAYVTHAVFPNQSYERFMTANFAGPGDRFAYFWITDSCPQTVKAISQQPPFEVLSLAGSIADALQI